MLRLATGYRVTSSVIPTHLLPKIRSFLTTLSRVEFMYLNVSDVMLCPVVWCHLVPLHLSTEDFMFASYQEEDRNPPSHSLGFLSIRDCETNALLEAGECRAVRGDQEGSQDRLDQQL